MPGRASLGLLIALLCSYSLPAQPRSDDLSVGGVVLNSATGEPVRRAVVRLRRIDTSAAPRGAAPDAAARLRAQFNATTLTDIGGAFQFSGVAPGMYHVSAEKPQFLNDGGGESLKLTASVADLKIKLAPLGVITGKVVDAENQPLRGVNVLALSVRVDDGVRVTHASRDVSTDDRGVYRLWNLTPGKYYIKAAGRSGGTFSYAGDNTPQLFADESFAPTFFGSGQTLDSATPVVISAGTEFEANLRLKLQPSFKIRGVLGNAAPHPPVKFELLAGDEDVSPSRVTLNHDTGRFEIQDVLPGAYILRATQDDDSAELPVNVGRADLNGLRLELLPPVEVRGSVRFTNVPDAPPGTDQTSVRRARAMVGRCMLSLHRSGIVLRSEFSDGSDFVVRKVQPGTYRSTIQCFGAYPNSISAGRQDLLANPLLTIAPGAPPILEIVASYGGGSLQVTIAPPDGAGRSDRVQVLLIPSSSNSTGPVLTPAFRLEARDFEAVAANLAPGTYTAYALLDRDNDIEFRNPAFLATLSGGVTVQVDDKKSTTVRLKVTR